MGLGVNNMNLVYAKALRLTFFKCLYLCNHSFIELLTSLAHDVFVVFPLIWNISLRVCPLGEEGSH